MTTKEMKRPEQPNFELTNPNVDLRVGFYYLVINYDLVVL